MVADLAIIAVCLFFSAFFSGMETALMGLGPLNMARGPSDRLFKLYQIKSKLLATLLIGNNLTIVMAALALHNFLGESANVFDWVIGFSAEILLFFLIAEALPKSIFRKLELRALNWLYWPLQFFYLLFRPLSFLFLYITRAIFRLAPENRELVKEDVFYFLSSHLPQDKTNVTESLLRLSSTKAKEVMTPLINVSSLEKHATVRVALGLLQSTHYSRYPVYDARGDNVIGYISVEDLITHRSADRVSSFMREAEFVPDTLPVDQLLYRMQGMSSPLVFVANEYGAVIGMVTLEDIGEELVGDIHSAERVQESPEIVPLKKDSYLVEGITDIDDFNIHFSLHIKKDDFETVAGFISNHLGSIPEKNQVVNTEFGRFTVKEANQKSIVRLIYEKNKKKP